MGYREFKLEIPSIANVQLKIIFILHYVFLSWATLYPWASGGYLMHGLIFLILLMWTILVKEGVDQVLLCMMVNLASIVLEIIILSVSFPRGDFVSTTAEYSGVIAIFNLILRVYSCYVLYNEWCSRSGAAGVAVVDGHQGSNSGLGGANIYEGGAVRSASVLAHYPGNSPRVAQNNRSDLPDIPASFTVVN